MRYNEIMNIVQQADKFAEDAHAAVNQTRKYTGEPYINHPREVRAILKKYATDSLSGGNRKYKNKTQLGGANSVDVTRVLTFMTTNIPRISEVPQTVLQQAINEMIDTTPRFIQRITVIPPNVVPENVMGKPGTILLIEATVRVLSTELVAMAVVVYVVMLIKIAFSIIYG